MVIFVKIYVKLPGIKALLMVAIATKTEAYRFSRILIFVIKAWIREAPKKLG
jgi:hypothetical protein